jgi:hypothetical protein
MNATLPSSFPVMFPPFVVMNFMYGAAQVTSPVLTGTV